MFVALESNQFDPSVDAEPVLRWLFWRYSLCYSKHFRTISDEQIAGQSIGNINKFIKFGLFWIGNKNIVFRSCQLSWKTVARQKSMFHSVHRITFLVCCLDT